MYPLPPRVPPFKRHSRIFPAEDCTDQFPSCPANSKPNITAIIGMNYAQALARPNPPRTDPAQPRSVVNDLQWGIYLTAEGVNSARDAIRADLDGISDDSINTIFQIMSRNQSPGRGLRMDVVERHFPRTDEQERAFKLISDGQTKRDARTKMNAMRQALVDGIGNGVRRAQEFGLQRLQKSLPSWNQRSFEDFQGWLLGERTNLCNVPGGPLDIMATATAVIVGIGNLHSHSNGPDELSPEETKELCQAIRRVVVNAGAIFTALQVSSPLREDVNRRRGSSGSIDVTDVDDLARVTGWMKRSISSLRKTFQGHGGTNQCILTGETTDHNCWDTSIHSIADIRREHPLYQVLPCTFVEGCEKDLAGCCPLAHDTHWRSWFLPLYQIKLEYCRVRDRCADRLCFKPHSVFELRQYDPSFMTIDCHWGPNCSRRDECRFRHDDDDADREVIYHAVRTERAIQHFKSGN